MGAYTPNGACGPLSDEKPTRRKEQITRGVGLFPSYSQAVCCQKSKFSAPLWELAAATSQVSRSGKHCAFSAVNKLATIPNKIPTSPQTARFLRLTHPTIASNPIQRGEQLDSYSNKCCSRFLRSRSNISHARQSRQPSGLQAIGRNFQVIHNRKNECSSFGEVASIRVSGSSHTPLSFVSAFSACEAVRSEQ